MALHHHWVEGSQDVEKTGALISREERGSGTGEEEEGRDGSIKPCIHFVCSSIDYNMYRESDTVVLQSHVLVLGKRMLQCTYVHVKSCMSSVNSY